jgi:hypothetical protein
MTVCVLVRTRSRSIGLILVVPALGALNAHRDPYRDDLLDDVEHG